LSPLAVTRIDAAAIAAVTPTKAGGVEMVAKSAKTRGDGDAVQRDTKRREVGLFHGDEG
jgi:hypothetical protein